MWKVRDKVYIQSMDAFGIIVKVSDSQAQVKFTKIPSGKGVRAGDIMGFKFKELTSGDDIVKESMTKIDRLNKLLKK